MTITLRQVETFVWIAALKNFRRVAEHMNTTQPNISQRITALEDALGLRLFERTGAVTLTEQGRALLPLAERVLEAAEAFARAGDVTRETSVLRLGVAETVAETWLRRFLREMERRAPNVVVDLVVDLTVTLKRDLLERTLDLAFLNGPISELAVTNLALGRVPLSWVATPAIASQLPRRVKAEDLSRFPILTQARHTQPYLEVAAYFRRHNEALSRPMSSSNLSACLDLALHGHGIASLPRAVVEPHLRSGALQVLDCDWVPSPMNFTASYLTSPLRPAVEAAAALATELVDWSAPSDTIPP